MASSSNNQEQDDFSSMSTEELMKASREIDESIISMKEQLEQITRELEPIKKKTDWNKSKINRFKTYWPRVDGIIREVLEIDSQEEDGANVNNDSRKKTKFAVVRLFFNQRNYLSHCGLIDSDNLKPGDLVAVHFGTKVIMKTIPFEYDDQVLTTQVYEKPRDYYNDIGGQDKQIEELIEAVVLPITHKDRFQTIGIESPKGVLLYGPPGTGKTSMARACASQTDAAFFRLTGPQLVQRGPEFIRHTFKLAKEKSPSIIFIDEIDAIGFKRSSSGGSQQSEVRLAFVELVNELDDISKNDDIKVIAATNRVDSLDPSLTRSGNFDKKIELTYPSEKARARILRIHSRKMALRADVNFEELARSTDHFSGAQLKAVCAEAGMMAIRRDATEVRHEDFNEGINTVQGWKKLPSFNYYT